MRWFVLTLFIAHAAIHLLGFAKAFELGELPQLTQPISKAMGMLWLAAALALGVAATLMFVWPRGWWAVAFMAVALSQAVIFTAWSDAKFGTIANALLVIVSAYGLASQGPWSSRAAYVRAVQQRALHAVEASRVNEDELAGYPAPLACHLRRAGVIGQPRVHHFVAKWRGRIRGGPDAPWMEFTAEQTSFVDEPARFFLMRATRNGLPVDVFHAFANRAATMRVELLSLFPMVDASGPELTRAEVVTIFNDLSIVAPSALIDPQIRWETVDAHSVRGHYTVGKDSVSAVLRFDAACDLVDFVSDDRLAGSADGKTFVAQRWSTPILEHARFGALRLGRRAEARWHPSEGDFAYLEIELVDLAINPPLR